MNNIQSALAILIIGGAFILVMAIIRASRLLHLAKSVSNRQYWLVSVAFMYVFLATYLALFFFRERVQFTGLVTGIILFLGSLFVFMVVTSGLNTLKNIIKSEKSYNEDIASRKKTEEQLQETSMILQTTFDLAFDGILAVDAQGKIINYNKRFAEMWKIPEEVLAVKDDKMARDFVLGQLKEPAKFIEKIEELYSKPELESFDILEFKDGRTFERYSKPEKKDGKIFGRVWDFIDVTEKKKTEIELNALNRRFTQIFNFGPVALAISNIEKNEFTHVNQKFAELTGYEKTELIEKSSVMFSIISREEINRIAALGKEGKKSTGEHQMQLKTRSGEIKDVIISSEIIDIDHCLCVTTALVDITEQKQTERQLLNSEKTFMQMFNFSPVPLSISVAENGKLIYVNDAFCQALGFTREELIGKTSVELKILGEEQRIRIKDLSEEKDGKIKDMETSINRKDGKMIQVLFSVERLEIDGIDSALIAFVDITGIKSSEQSIRVILENIGEGVIVTDTKKNVVHYNNQAKEILGMHGVPYSSLWSNKYELFYPDEQTIFPVQNFPLDKAIQGQEINDSEILLIDRESRKKTLLRVSGHPILTEKKEVLAAVVTIKDITKLKETEKALKETELKYRNSIGFKQEQKLSTKI